MTAPCRFGIVLAALGLLGCGPDVASPGTDAGFRLLDAGARHSCGLSLDREVYCWGGNDDGQLGTVPPTPSSPAPLQLLTAPLVVNAVSAGDPYTCALIQGGEAACWGGNEGALRRVAGGVTGIAVGTAICLERPSGPVECIDAPGDSPVPVAGTEEAKELAVGGFGCVLDADGFPRCWLPGQATAEPVAGAPALSGLSIGLAHACGIALDGTAWCWGDNTNGQLGDGTNTSRSAAAPVQPIAPMTFVAITAGGTHTCAVATTEETYCWGLASSGQLGLGGDLPPQLATTRPLAPVDAEVRFVALSAGHAHTCAVTTEAEVWCWGANEVGQAGTGDYQAPLAPRRIAR